MSLLFDGLHRILGLGLVCGALLTLGGSGQKEILRLGCACLTVVVLLSMLQRTPIPAFDLSRYENIVQQRVDETQTELRRAALRETEAQLEQHSAHQCGAENRRTSHQPQLPFQRWRQWSERYA